MNRLNFIAAAAGILLLIVIAPFSACDPADPQPTPDAGTPAQDSGTSGPNAAHFPAATTAAGIQTFLAGEPYLANGWVAETAMPRPPSNGVSPHETVRVYFNPALVQSFDRGNGLDDAGVVSATPPHDRYSMAVKEFYDSADGGAPTRVGRAAMLKTGDGGASGDWTYFCVGPASQCAGTAGTETAPVYGAGPAAFQCSSCHGGVVFTTPP